ncbi:MAG: NADH:flavin oxidoreductase [Bdellovibrionaceae bacterium]|nr:NADH:flavin oxidoreductase [Pseudobdellovibrionaceae bacterium]
MKPNRWTDYKFKNGKTAKNRVVVPPMASQTADTLGFVTKKTIQHYEELSNSGAGIIFAEYTYIHQSGKKGEPNQLAVDDDSKIAGLSEISHAIHKSGALAGLQIVHVGGKTSSALTGLPLLGPSSIPIPVKGQELETPKKMSANGIEEMIGWYIQAARRAEIAGFDIVELHAAHGYGLNQWLSPITNHRDDEFGGDIIGRSNLLLQIVSQIKQLFPNLLVAARMPAQDHFAQGLQPTDMRWVAQKLENIGIDLIDISSGIGGWRRPRGINGQGYLVSDAAQIKQAITIPVIGVGGIQEGSFIDEILLEQKVDFAAVGRAILKEPSLWKEINLEGLSYVANAAL